MSVPQFRALHSYIVTLDKEVTETSVREENGQRITTEAKVIKPVEYTILLKEPNRTERNELGLFKDVTYGEAIKLGLIPKVKMQQILGKGDASNPLSEDEDKNLVALNKKITELGNEYTRLGSVVLNGGSPEDEERKQRKAEVLQEWLLLQNKAINLNAAYQSVYASTAEHYTQTKLLTWLSLFLTYVRDPGVAADAAPRPMFPGNDFAAKDAVLGDLETTKDPLLFKVMDKLPSYWMLYLFGRARTPEEFKEIEAEWAKDEALRQEAELKTKMAEEAKAVKTEDIAPPAPVPVVPSIEQTA